MFVIVSCTHTHCVSCTLCLFQGGKFHLASQGLREEVERVSKELHKWEPYNVDQLVRRAGRREGGSEGESK